MQDYADALVTFVRTNETWAAPAVLALAFGESIAFVSLILPFWGMLVAIGALVGFGEPQFWLIWVAASVGAALGDWVSFWIGRYFKEDVGRIWPLSRHPDLLPRGHVFFERWGPWAIVIGRFFGPLRAAVPLVAGIVDMDRWKFQLANWNSAFLWAFVLLVFGDIIGRSVGYVRHLMGW
ncbi:MAG: DedA family protein [Hyphomicrobiaceae bacterium]